VIREFTYDAFGQVLTARIVGDAETEEVTKVFTYDEYGNIETITDGEGNLTSFTYNAMGQVTTITDPRGKVWKNEYDDMGRLKKRTDPLNHSWKFEYDAVGNLEKTTDPLGRDTILEYDRYNRLIRKTDTAGNTTKYEYDLNGNLVRKVDAEGIEEQRFYDLDGRLRRVVDGEGNQIAYAYGGGTSCNTCGGNARIPSRIIYPIFTVEHEFDKRGRIVRRKYILDDETTYEYIYEYDAVGRLLTVTDEGGRTVSYAYDELGRKTEEIDPLGNVMRFAYDARGNLLRFVNANGNITRFRFDRADRLIREELPLGQVFVFSYDGAGNLVERIDAMGRKTVYVYDDAGRLHETQYFSQSDDTVPAKTLKFTLNELGLVTSCSDETVSIARTYDDAYRLTGETVNYGAVSLGYSYTYYRNGRKKSFRGPDNVTYTYGYNAAGRLANVKIPTVGSITYAAYHWFKPETIMLPGGVRREYVYDGLMRPSTIRLRNGAGEVLMERRYGYACRKRIASIRTENGSVGYEYDGAGRLTAARYASLSRDAFAYDAAGNRIASAGTVGAWSYNANEQLVGIGAQNLRYDENGNLIRRLSGENEVTYEYDFENRLTRVTDDEGKTIAEYYYDPWGRRLWKEANGIRTYFLNADEGIVGEYDASGSQIRAYGFKPNSSWSTGPLFVKVGEQYYFYHNEHLGTPAMVTDMSGAIVWCAEYRAFGEAVVSGQGTLRQPFRFPGQYFDEETGLCYNFQRYYDPNLGRYLQIDPLEFGNSVTRNVLPGCRSPLATGRRREEHLYVYAENNPVTRLDPTGTLSGSIGGSTGCIPVLGLAGIKISISVEFERCCDCKTRKMKTVFVVKACVSACSVGSGGPSFGGGVSSPLNPFQPPGCCPDPEAASYEICVGCHAGAFGCNICVEFPGQKITKGCDVGFDVDIDVGISTDPTGVGCEGGGCAKFVAGIF